MSHDGDLLNLLAKNAWDKNFKALDSFKFSAKPSGICNESGQFKALETRFTSNQIKNRKFNFEELLAPTRVEDKGSDLWSVFNVVQEKIIDGDFTYIAGKKIRKARQIKNFKIFIFELSFFIKKMINRIFMFFKIN